MWQLSQERRCVSNFNAIDPAVPLLIEWKGSRARRQDQFDDTIFVFIDDCRGEVVFFEAFRQKRTAFPSNHFCRRPRWTPEGRRAVHDFLLAMQNG